MLPILHKAHFLFREDAYREYCWSVDQWGSYQPASFIFLSYEALRDAAVSRELRITGLPLFVDGSKRTFPTREERDARDATPSRHYGLICRTSESTDAEVIETFLRRGDNVIALLPNEIAAIWSNGRSENVEKTLQTARQCLEVLGVGALSARLSGKAWNREEVWWEEVPRDSGRLFITSDAFLSDGAFMEGYGKSEKNSEKINALIDSFAARRQPLLHVISESTERHWPCHEPLTVSLRIKNFGPPLTDVTLVVDYEPTCEPTTSTEAVLPKLATLAEVTVAFQFIPRVSKQLVPFGVRAHQRGTPLEVSGTVSALTVAASLRTLRTAQAVSDDAEYTRLTSILGKTNQLPELHNFTQLAKLDPEACLNKLRRVSERLANHVVTRLGGSIAVRDFNGAIQAIQAHRALSAKAVGYLHTLRVIGNLASHPTGESLTVDDVRIASFAFAAVVEELLDRGIL